MANEMSGIIIYDEGILMRRILILFMLIFNAHRMCVRLRDNDCIRPGLCGFSFRGEVRRVACLS